MSTSPSRQSRSHASRRAIILLGAVVMTLACAGSASAQLGALVSPGRLSSAHADLEGIGNCLTCHALGSGVSATKCLTCHEPVAERIAERRGVHAEVTTGCVTCHVEHAGVEGELRPFDQITFDHATTAAFPLDGFHVGTTVTCESCHTARSFLESSPDCASCHVDAHQGTLGPDCTSCHTSTVRFAEAATVFDHALTEFPLTGGHVATDCVSCHRDGVYADVPFASCSNCHTDPHAEPLGSTCSSCHTTDTWLSTSIDHSLTTFPLRGAHGDVGCAQCHTAPALQVKPVADLCSSCHLDVHLGTFTEDCSACHDETSFRSGTFDHSTTDFPLTDGHEGVTCIDCHRATEAQTSARPLQPVVMTRTAQDQSLDFRGLDVACASCHQDPHRDELGTQCESCHTASAFLLAVFDHSNQTDFFDGEHVSLLCVECHESSLNAQADIPEAPAPRVGFTTTPRQCASCHNDVHLGQVDTTCETCHAIDGPEFAVVAFDHDSSVFPLTGEHATAMCALCHLEETASFPSGPGTAVRLTGLDQQCATCHDDPHGGQLDGTCETCHTTNTFEVSDYLHQDAGAQRDFFRGEHLRAECVQCHAPIEPDTSSVTTGSLTSLVSYQVSTTCTECHEDVHRGQLGRDCGTCHRLE